MSEILKKLMTTPKGGSIERERLNSLINSMADGVIAIDEKQKILLYNGAALNILDLNSPMQGKYIGTVMNVIDKNNRTIDIAEFITKIKTPTSNRDMLLLYPDKSTINLYISIAPVHLGFGKMGDKGYVVLLRDITHEKSLEEERDEFISVVSHELRTPIAIAEGNIGNAQMIAEKGGAADIKEALRLAHDQILFLSDMINDLATLSRAERGKLEIEIEDINVHDMISDLEKNYGPDAQKKKLALHIEVDPKLELLKSSKLYVREILQNFITNAIKYTEKGSVTISARMRDAIGVEFKISDTGIGLSKGDKERIFDKFFRSEDYRTRKNNGTGLGLYVTMKLARMLHAEINVESELNKGSVFTIFVPNLQKPPKQASKPA